MILVIIGPSGSGKSTVVRSLNDLGLAEPYPTWTDRPPRPGEQNGTDHVFVSPAEFSRNATAGRFLGTVDLFTHRYGLATLPSEPRAAVLTVTLRAPLVEQFRSTFNNEAILVYQIQDTQQRLGERLRERGSDEEELTTRLAEFDAETALGSKLADRVFVNDSTINNLTQRVSHALRLDLARTKTQPRRNAGTGILDSK